MLNHACVGLQPLSNDLVRQPRSAAVPGDGERDAEIAWQHGRGVPECPSPVYHDGLIYMIKNGGIATCLDAKTGKQHYSSRMKARGPRYSSPVVGDGKIYAASARGQITIWKTGAKLQILAQNELGERIMATPALLDGHIYVRTETSLYCF
jgi:outer membrane protein assembly factor BamB